MMDAADVLAALVPSWSTAEALASYLAYVAAAGAVLPGKLVAGAVLPTPPASTTAAMVPSPSQMQNVVADRGLELPSTTFIFSVIVGATSYLDILILYTLTELFGHVHV
ncbi:hypothetical protein ZWY2020_056090 [Hordeum vulgare]|nr:hypothetical protein ZWY2020_056090 [Hordeum vulgare]